MKKVAFLALFLAFFGGCTNPSPTPLESQQHLYFNAMPSDIVQSFKKRFNANGLLECEITFKSSADMEVYYRIIWLDSQGFELRDSLNKKWRRIFINANREFVLTKLAPNKDAKNFKIYFERKINEYKKYY